VPAKVASVFAAIMKAHHAPENDSRPTALAITATDRPMIKGRAYFISFLQQWA
jgi:hypothetical protein